MEGDRRLRKVGPRSLAVVLTVLALVLPAILSPPAAKASPANPQWDEWDSLNLINRERRAAGLRPLAMVPQARDVARDWSAAMRNADVLSHNPDVFSVLRALYPSYQKIGENVGVGGSVTTLHTAFMNSTGHRSNILGDYQYAGVGVVWAATKMWVTVDFVKSSSPLPFLTRTPVTRVGGASDPDTSVLMSRRLGAGSAAAVVVARADGFADALAGGPLAAVNRGPLLLSPPDRAPPNVVEEARRVVSSAGTVFLLGGPAALAPGVEADFLAAGLRVVRLAGPDRFATATAVAARVNPAPTEVFLASGVSFPDAVVASAPAGARKVPVLLLAPTSVPAATSAYLVAHSAARRVLVGGRAAVADNVATAAGVTERIAGQDRYATSVAVAQRFFGATNRVAPVSGGRFQDALVASPEAGRDGYPVVLTASPPSDATYGYIGAQANRWVFGLVVGRPNDVTDDTVATLFS